MPKYLLMELCKCSIQVNRRTLKLIFQGKLTLFFFFFLHKGREGIATKKEKLLQNPHYKHRYCIAPLKAYKPSLYLSLDSQVPIPFQLDKLQFEYLRYCIVIAVVIFARWRSNHVQGPRYLRKQKQPCDWSRGIIPPPFDVSIASNMVTTSSISGRLSGLASQHRFITFASELGQHRGISGLRFCSQRNWDFIFSLY